MNRLGCKKSLLLPSHVTTAQLINEDSGVLEPTVQSESCHPAAFLAQLLCLPKGWWPVVEIYISQVTETEQGEAGVQREVKVRITEHPQEQQHWPVSAGTTPQDNQKSRAGLLKALRHCVIAMVK